MTRNMIRTSLVLAILGTTSAVSTGCTSAYQRALGTGLRALDVTATGFVAWDLEHQQTLVDKAKTMSEGLDSIGQYRDKREKVMLALHAAYSSLAAAALVQSPEALVAAGVAATDVYKLISALKD